ncbi:MAG: ABC transporter substrate-binding protein [Desulfobacterales bacterium]|nr:ABC transporter substrate-binding protein [Desulfobacterales bacterium]
MKCNYGRFEILFLLLITIIFTLGISISEPIAETKTVNIGYLGPLSGPASGWCLPGLTGVNIWVDEQNSKGGLKVGNDTYKIKIIKYDTEGVPSKAIDGVKKLILQDNVVLLQTQGGADATAIQPFVTRQKVIVMGLTSDTCAPEHPYYMGISENYPMYHCVSIQYIADKYPLNKKIALTVQDEVSGRGSMAWAMAAAEANNMEIVYSKFYSTETTDFAPIISAILATKPDVVSLCASWPEYRAHLVEQLYLQGFKGQIETSEYELTDLFAKVPKSFLDHAVGHYPRLDNKLLPADANKFYSDWQKRYGKGGKDDIGREYYSIDYEYRTQLQIWAYGAQKAGSVEPEKVRNALMASKDLPHTLGSSNWWGDEVFGINTSLISPQYITEILNGEEVTIDKYDIIEWYNKNKEVTLKYLKKYDLLWNQR